MESIKRFIIDNKEALLVILWFIIIGVVASYIA